MDDLASKLSELLNSPGGIEKIKSLAGLLGGAAKGESSSEQSSSEQSAPEKSSSEKSSSEQSSSEQPKSEQDSSPLGFDTDTLKILAKVAPLLSNFRQEDDNTRFLRALRPLLGEVRQKKLDEAIKLLQLMRVLPLLKSNGIL